MTPAAAKRYPRWLRVPAVVVGLIGLPLGWLAALDWLAGPPDSGTPAEGIVWLVMALVIAAGMLLVTWVGQLTEGPRRRPLGRPVYGRFGRVLIGVVGIGLALLFVGAGGRSLREAGWSAAAAVAVPVSVGLVVTFIASVALVWAGAGSDARDGLGRVFVRSLVSGLRIVGLGCAGVIVLAAVLAVGYGAVLLIGVIADWLHSWLGMPTGLGVFVGLLLILAAWYGPIALGMAINERRQRGRRRVPDQRAYNQPVTFGSRRADPLHPRDVEPIVGQRVTRVVRTYEEPYDPPPVNELGPLWDVVFELADGTYLACTVNDLGDAKGVVADRAEYVKAYQRVEAIAGVGEDALAVVDLDGAEFLWAQVDDRWTVEVHSFAALPRPARITVARTVIDRLRGTGFPPEPGDATVGTGSRPHDPLRPSDVEDIIGAEVTEVTRDYESASDPHGKAVADGFWYLRFTLAGTDNEVTCRVVALNGDTALLDAERAAWAALGDVETVAGLGDDAFAGHDRYRDATTIWTRLDTMWTVQIQAAPGADRATLIGLATTVLDRLRLRLPP